MAAEASVVALAIAIAVAVIIFSLKKKHTTQWHSQRKKQDDYLVTKIHSKWYNLTNFDHHPGGPIALSLVQRRDGTALFESHHPFTKHKRLLQILSKYEVPKSKETAYGCHLLDERDDGLAYEWNGIDNDVFVSDLKELIIEYFSSIAKNNGSLNIMEAAKATPARWCLVIALIISFFITLPFYIHGHWFFIMLSPVLAWLAIANYWHDATHFALSSDWRINAFMPYLLPLLSSPSVWYHQHTIGHHAYTNIGHKDPDLAHAPQLMREHNSIRWRSSHSNQAHFLRILLVWSIASGIGLNILSDLRSIVKLTYNNVVPCMQRSRLNLAAHILGRVFYIYIAYVWPFFAFPLWKAIVWSIVPNAVFSICFMLNSQVNHMVGPCIHASDRNFYKHQVVTAQNFGNDSWFCYFFSGGLNYQIEHHLFPTINHCHLPALAPGVKRICQKHGVPYNEVSSYKEAFVAHLAHTAEMAIGP
jgi:delta11-fatty-acid desaturase